ncbi:MAG: hypothetical protein HKP42_08285 [Maribacter sp.]|nr:hypothetical protein [Bacteroidia bacterium]NNK76047.1 hypothetical protein [Maribacter sp.]
MKYAIQLLIAVSLLPLLVIAQEIEKDTIEDKPSRPAFESSFIIDNPTNVLFNKNTLEAVISHRFGLINGGTNDLVGFWAPSNIRIGVSYAIHERITVGFGTTKFDRLQDFNLKLGVLKQTRSDKIPVSVAYYGNFTVDARPKENFRHLEDRYSNFHQLIIARRFNPNLSLQLAPSISHYNVVENTMRNDMVAIAFGGRYKISSQTAVMFDYSQPITEFLQDNPHPGLSIGFEFATSAHAFQIYMSNYNGIVPQKNYMFNDNDFFEGDFLIGFTITRLYNF